MNIKLLSTTVFCLASASAMAVPASTDSLIKALVGSDLLTKVLENEKNVGEVNISRVSDFRDDTTIEYMCGGDTHSRSASVLKAEVIYERGSGVSATVYSSTHYFSTRGSPESLKACTGNN